MLRQLPYAKLCVSITTGAYASDAFWISPRKRKCLCFVLCFLVLIALHLLHCFWASMESHIYIQDQNICVVHIKVRYTCKYTRSLHITEAAFTCLYVHTPWKPPFYYLNHVYFCIMLHLSCHCNIRSSLRSIYSARSNICFHSVFSLRALNESSNKEILEKISAYFVYIF